MNKSELVEQLATRAGLDKRQAEAALMAFVDTIKDAAKSGEKVSVLGFGTFAPKDVPAKSGVSALNGKPWKTPAAKAVRFSMGSGFKEALNTKGGSKKAAPAPAKKAAAAKKAPAGRATATKAAPAKKAATPAKKAAKSTKKR